MGQPTIQPTPPTTSFAHKTVLITGANTGIGYETARQCLILNAERVIIAVRSISKGQEAISALRADPAVKNANPNARLDIFELDLDDYESGLRFAQKVAVEVDVLDVLICNAGVNMLNYTKSKSGHERVMQVNAYTHFLIVLELIPLLRSTAVTRESPSRLVMLSSSTQNQHGLSRLPADASILDHLDDQSTYSGMKQYPSSKLVVNAFSQHLASIIPAEQVIINSVCPGMVATGFDRQMPVWVRGIMFVVRKVVARPVEEGARTLVHAAGVVGPESHGKFLSHNSFADDTPLLQGKQGEQFRERLWKDVLADVRKVDKNCWAE